jgi:hypothetical protein
MALHGQPVVHASAVETDAGIVALSGPSGIGKTTTARLWAEVSNWQIVSEDMLPVVYADGWMASFAEEGINKWTASSSAMVEQGTRHVSYATLTQLEELTSKAPRRLAAIVFLSERVASVEQAEVQALTGPNLFANWLRQIFSSSVLTEVPFDAVRWAGDISGNLPAFLGHMPDGCAQLRQYLSTQSLMMALKERSHRSEASQA